MHKETVQSYEQLVASYAKETEHFWQYVSDRILREFIRQVRRVRKGKVLDVGCGPGRDALIFQKAGLRVFCLDAAAGMVDQTSQKRFLSVQADFLKLPFKDQVFNGVWAYTSLLHVPKSEFPRALEEIKRVLVPGGILGLGLIEGEKERISYNEGKDFPRYFAYYQETEVRDHLANCDFEVIYFGKIRPKSQNYLHFLAQK